jgi:hypothetical protein
MNPQRRQIKTADIEQRLAKLGQQLSLMDGISPRNLQLHPIKSTNLEQPVEKLEKLLTKLAADRDRDVPAHRPN